MKGKTRFFDGKTKGRKNFEEPVELFVQIVRSDDGNHTPLDEQHAARRSGSGRRRRRADGRVEDVEVDEPGAWEMISHTPNITEQ